MSRNLPLYLLFCAICLAVSCKASEPVVIPLREPEAAVAPRDTLPDVIRLAIYFVEHEGMDELLSLNLAQIATQDREAYYVSFPVKSPAKKKPEFFVVKVYKQNGWTEWSFR